MEVCRSTGVKYLLTGGGKDPVVGGGPLVVVVAVVAVVRGADREGRLGSCENCTPCLPSITTPLTWRQKRKEANQYCNNNIANFNVHGTNVDLRAK